jgi:sigma-B regulation protein RsbU (phosphoserine phosphatase)
MNGQIEENFPSGYFVSAFYALLDEKSSSIELANAAPEPALVLRKNGRIEIICRGGQPMGLLPKEFTDSETFAGTSIELKSGDVLFLFTDGLTDIKISENERLGIDRLSRWLAEESAKTPQQLCEAIYQRATGMALPESIDDDIMILAVARR